MTNEDLAAMITRIDPSAKSWVYNWYCGTCARFLYPEDKSATCKKCNSPKHGGIPRPIPFITSATAVEKLVKWLRDVRETHPHVLVNLALTDIQVLVSKWIEGTARDYKHELVDSVGKRLAAILKQRSVSQEPSLVDSNPTA